MNKIQFITDLKTSVSYNLALILKVVHDDKDSFTITLINGEVIEDVKFTESSFYENINLIDPHK